MKGNIHNEYLNYKASDFALDETFIDWIKNPASKYRFFWESWCHDYPSREEETNKARIMVLALQFDQKDTAADEIEKSWQQLKEGKVNKKKEKGSGNKGIFRMAAILALAISFTFILNKPDVAPPIIKYTEEIVKKEALAGQKLSLYLPDGSRVKLNAESYIEYPKEFASNIREVKLWGEAFFEVEKDPDRPFRVRIGDVTTEVLGTAFNVNYYPDSPQIQIALAEGSIRISGTNDEKEGIVLTQGEILTINKNDRDFKVSKYDEEEILGWKEGVLHFDKISFEEAISRMERWYGVTFNITEKTTLDPSWRFYGKFKNKSVEYILKVISYPDLFNYRIKEDTVIIY